MLSFFPPSANFFSNFLKLTKYCPRVAPWCHWHRGVFITIRSRASVIFKLHWNYKKSSFLRSKPKPGLFSSRCQWLPGFKNSNVLIEHLREMEAMLKNTSACQSEAQMGQFSKNNLGGKNLVTLSLKGILLYSRCHWKSLSKSSPHPL